MNEQNNNLPPRPPVHTPPSQTTAIQNLWRDTEPLDASSATLGSIFESLLREPFRILKAADSNHSLAARITFILVATFVVCAGIFGLVVGTFSMGTQLWAAPVKILAGTAISMLICLPSLYIFSCLSGSRISLATTGVLMAGSSALIGILLIGFAPVFWIFAQSTEAIAIVGVLLLIIWMVCLVFATRLIRNTVSSFSQGGAKHIGIWVFIFTLVTLQMSCTLRPIIGTSNDLLTQEKKFFVAHWIEQLTPDFD